jgi:hypothetical protein
MSMSTLMSSMRPRQLPNTEGSNAVYVERNRRIEWNGERCQ